MGATAPQKKYDSVFDTKNAILSAKFAPVSPLDYYDALYGEDINESRAYITSTDEKRIKRAKNIDELLGRVIDRRDAYVHPCSFFWKLGLDTLNKIYAYVVDLDSVTTKDLRFLISHRFFGMNPSFIVNSGNGLHLVYVLDKPLKAYHSRHERLKSILKALKDVFDISGVKYHVDKKTSLMQSYRVVGSRTKAGDICTAFKSGQKWSIETLTTKLGIPCTFVDPTPNDPAELHRKEGKKKDRKPQKIVHFPSGRKGFYGHVLSRMGEVAEGNRETAMFALSVIGYKCRIKLEQLEEDIEAIYDVLAYEGKPLKRCEIKKALNGYQSKYVLARSERLEEWLGFTFPRRTKRNGRTQEEHLKLCNESRSRKMAEAKSEAVRGYLAKHPEASNAEVARALKMCRKTVAKYRQSVQSVDIPAPEGVGRTIAYDTCPLGLFRAEYPDMDKVSVEAKGEGKKLYDAQKKEGEVCGADGMGIVLGCSLPRTPPS